MNIDTNLGSVFVTFAHRFVNDTTEELFAFWGEAPGQGKIFGPVDLTDGVGLATGAMGLFVLKRTPEALPAWTSVWLDTTEETTATQKFSIVEEVRTALESQQVQTSQAARQARRSSALMKYVSLQASVDEANRSAKAARNKMTSTLIDE